MKFSMNLLFGLILTTFMSFTVHAKVDLSPTDTLTVPVEKKISSTNFAAPLQMLLSVDRPEHQASPSRQTPSSPFHYLESRLNTNLIRSGLLADLMDLQFSQMELRLVLDFPASDIPYPFHGFW